MTPTRFFAGAPAIHHGVARRLFLRQAGALSLLTGAGAPLALNLLAAGSAAARTAQDYRAVVCLFMFGGNDAFNMVLPTDAASWAAYTATRNLGSNSIALLAPGIAPVASASAGTPARLGGVLPIRPRRPQGRTFALHPLMKSLLPLFGTETDIERRLAIVANVGPLVQPTSKDQYANPAHPRPPRLFSHNDQQSIWQTMDPEGATPGWGGRMADAVLGNPIEAPVFTAISAAGNAVWLSGNSVRQYQVGGAGPVRLGADAVSQVYGSPVLASALDRFSRMHGGNHAFEADVAAIAGRSIDAESSLRSRLRAPSDDDFGTPPVGTAAYVAANDAKLQYDNPLSGVPEFNPVAQQLQVVARLIDVGRQADSGVRRQVFFVSLGGFDTHSGQNSTHADLMARVAHALAYFDTTLGKINARHNVTTFTASDFGRTFTSNGDGTDHGWGAHHFVMGGAVRGGDVYGTFPTLVARTPGTNDFNGPDQVRNGALLPTTSVDQFGAALGRWFGVMPDQYNNVFPNLKNFGSDPLKDLGFMS
jgi:uncharacterized protein (DUF1501 family)